MAPSDEDNIDVDGPALLLFEFEDEDPNLSILVKADPDPERWREEDVPAATPEMDVSSGVALFCNIWTELLNRLVELRGANTCAVVIFQGCVVVPVDDDADVSMTE